MCRIKVLQKCSDHCFNFQSIVWFQTKGFYSWAEKYMTFKNQPHHQILKMAFWMKTLSDQTQWMKYGNFKNLTKAHCSKSSFFVQKFNFDFPRKLSIFVGWKTRENVVVLDFLAVDIFDFTRKIVKTIFGWKTREDFGVLSKLNFWTKIWLFE